MLKILVSVFVNVVGQVLSGFFMSRNSLVAKVYDSHTQQISFHT